MQCKCGEGGGAKADEAENECGIPDKAFGVIQLP